MANGLLKVSKSYSFSIILIIYKLKLRKKSQLNSTYLQNLNFNVDSDKGGLISESQISKKCTESLTIIC